MEVAFICIPVLDCYKTFMSVVTMEGRNIERIPKFIMSEVTLTGSCVAGIAYLVERLGYRRDGPGFESW